MSFKGMNRDALRKAAAERSIAGRSKMSAEELSEAVRKSVQSAPTPLTGAQRVAHYDAQNGPGRELTPAQRRRLRHKRAS